MLHKGDGYFSGVILCSLAIVGSQCVVNLVILTCWLKVFCLKIACADGQSMLSNRSSEILCFFLIYSLRIGPCRSRTICSKSLPVLMTPFDSKNACMDVCGIILLFDCGVSS